MKINNHHIQKTLAVCCLVMILLTSNSCRKAVQIDAPTTSLIGSNVFTDPQTATAVLTGIYENMHSNSSFSDGTSGISTYMGTAADEMRNYYSGAMAIQFYTNGLTASPGPTFWSQFFQLIYVTNSAMVGINGSTSLSVDVKQQLLGEAKFMRAFMNFYAVNLYGDIPIVTSTDYKINNSIKRSPVADVYQAIIADLLSAQSLLTSDYKSGTNVSTTEKIRPNKAAATALLARAYLYAGDYKNAEIQATAMIGNSSYSIVPMAQVFLKNSSEAIWQLATANPSVTTVLDAYWFILKSTPGVSYHVTLSPFLLNAFETGDGRRTNWVGSYTKGASTYYYPYKYKNNVTSSAVTEYQMILRMGEQYLIRAEARAQLDEPNAIDDLNAIRRRAGLLNYAGPTDKISLLAAILHERQIELFSEWGHRWFDLKRNGKLDAVMGGATGVTATKGGTWSSTDALLPLPLSEVQINPNLAQNPGYTN